MNIVCVRQGVKAGVNPLCEKEAFLMFMSEAVDYIIHFTNMQGRRMVAKWNYNHPDKRKTWNIQGVRGKFDSFIRKKKKCLVTTKFNRLKRNSTGTEITLLSASFT